MKKIILKQYLVDAFTDEVFKGNPAAVCILEQPLSDNIMQNIALENNLSETAFILKHGKNYNLRWFTPGGEIDLCGHATLASAYVVMNFLENNLEEINFQTKSGILTVKKNQDLYEINMPAYKLVPVDITNEIVQAIGFKPLEIYIGRDLVCVMNNEDEVLNAKPDLIKVCRLDGLLLHLTAKGSKYDCITRTFAPKCGVNEDSVCGSGHCHIVPYWLDKLNKENIIAYQASKRSGTLYCSMKNANNRVILAGKAALYSKCEIYPVS